MRVALANCELTLMSWMMAAFLSRLRRISLKPCSKCASKANACCSCCFPTNNSCLIQCDCAINSIIPAAIAATISRKLNGEIKARYSKANTNKIETWAALVICGIACDNSALFWVSWACKSCWPRLSIKDNSTCRILFTKRKRLLCRALSIATMA